MQVTINKLEQLNKKSCKKPLGVTWYEKAPKIEEVFGIKFTLYHNYIVLNFEALLETLNQCTTSDPTYLSNRILVSVAFHNSLMSEPFFIIHNDRKQLKRQFIAVIERRHKLIVEDVKDLHPNVDNFDILPYKVKKD